MELIDFKIYVLRLGAMMTNFQTWMFLLRWQRWTERTNDLISEIAWEVGLENLIVISPLVFSRG